ncbi:MAG: mechanosensitive ion channel domain-containing protein [Pseudomonadota bacterium]
MDGASSSGEVVAAIGAWLASQGLNIVLGALILVVGWRVVGIFTRAFERWLTKSDHMDPIVESFLASLVRYGLIAVLIISALSVMGVQTTSLIAVLGAASLAVGLALQGSLTSLAAGVMIILLRPIRIGDYIEVAGQAGTVKSISLFMTELATYDNVQKLLPNSAVWGNTVTNYSVYQTRMLDIEVGIDFNDSIDEGLTVLKELAEADEKVLSDPAPNAFVKGLGASSVDLNLRVFVAASDYWPMRRSLVKRAKEAIEARGLTIPFPHTKLITAPETETTRPAGTP